MPVLKIFYDETLDDAVRTRQPDLQSGLSRMMRECMAADPAKCQIVLCASVHVSPLPVLVEMHYRANQHRSREVIAQAMKEIADVVGSALDTGLRIRAFDIDESTLHALDVAMPAES